MLFSAFVLYCICISSDGFWEKMASWVRLGAGFLVDSKMYEVSTSHSIRISFVCIWEKRRKVSCPFISISVSSLEVP